VEEGFLKIMILKLSLNLIAMGKGKVLLGVLAGVAVGAALGVLFAPDKGWNTRKRILKKGEDLKDDLIDKFEEFLDSLSVKADEVKDDISDFTETSKPKSKEANKKSRTATA
jgi:gas vesicle protein